MHLVSATVLLLACSVAAQKAAVSGAPAPPVAVPVKMPENPAKYAAAAAEWFPVMDQSIEARLGDKEAKGLFRFKNPRDHAVEWKHLTGSCTCSQAVFLVGDRKYELRSKTKQLFQITGPNPQDATIVETIPVGPGETGQIEMHVELAAGKAIANRVVSVDIHTTDAQVPMARLQLRVAVPQVIMVVPDDVNLGIIGNGESREFSAQVTSMVKDFQIRGASPFPKGVTATYEQHEKNGQAYWLVKGSFRQDTVGDTNTILEFQTNVPEAPTFHIKLHASVRAPIECKPPFFAVGRVLKGKGGGAKVLFTTADSKNLEVKAMHFENLNVAEKFVTLRSSKDGASVVVELEVGPDAPLGLIKGEVVVDFDHQVVKQRRILFNGFVR